MYREKFRGRAVDRFSRKQELSPRYEAYSECFQVSIVGADARPTRVNSATESSMVTVHRDDGG